MASPLGGLSDRADVTANAVVPSVLHCLQPTGRPPGAVLSKDSLGGGACGKSAMKSSKATAPV